MPNQIQKSIQGYISKIKKRENENQTKPKSFASSTSLILRGCKNPRTPSFRDLYRTPRRIETPAENTVPDHVGDHFPHISEDEDDGGERSFEIPDCSNNHRFYIPPTTFSSSLIEEATGSSTGITNHQEHVGERGQLKSDDFISVMKDSDNLYEDFKNSMQEMVEARVQQNGEIGWEFMEELLVCYLNLNENSSHSFIQRAFVDLVADLRDNQGASNAPMKPNSVPSSSKGKEKI